MLRLAVPIRALTQRFAFLFLVLAAFGLMLLGKAETIMMERMRAGVVDIVAPILDAASHPIATVTEVFETARQLMDLRSENERLRAQNARLLQWQDEARRLGSENVSFRNMLNFIPSPRAQSATARVIASSGGVFMRSVLVNAGRRHGIAKDQAVVTGEGLAGRVVSVGDGSARVLLITDLNSRIPVILGRTRERAILAGDNSDMPSLVFVNRSVEITPGARIVTSGHGGVFPPGIPVGVVATGGDSGAKVRPFVRLDLLEYLRIIEFRPASSGPEPESAMELPEYGP